MTTEQTVVVSKVELPATVAEFIAAVQAERRAQDEEWGGAEHDRTHCGADWYRYLDKQIDQLGQIATGHNQEQFEIAHHTDEFRTRLVKIAALAQAAYEAGW